jgi:sugar fermentation stimulation protein A
MRFAFPAPLVKGVFLERPNRYVAYIDVDGTAVRTHVPDPGRLKELLIPGVNVYVEDAGDNPNRKTRYSLLLVESPDKTRWVSLDTQLPNRVVRRLLTEGLLDGWQDYALEKAEFAYGESRIDFLLKPRKPGKPRVLLEVKSVTLVMENGIARFPDAPTVRGARHLRELTAATTKGEYEAGVLFVVQRADANSVEPNHVTDPEFCRALSDAMDAGVKFSAICYDLSHTGIELAPGCLPVSRGLVVDNAV